MKTSSTRILLVVSALAVAVYWYASPYWALYVLKSAAERRDAETFNEHVDYPRLRESVKGQLTAFMAGQTKDSAGAGDDVGRAGMALGAMLGIAVADRLVDAFVRPEMVMRFMNEARWGGSPTAQDAPPADSPTSPGAGDKPVGRTGKTRWTTERPGVDKLIVYAGDDPTDAGGRIGLVLERSGFARWKLTEVRMPSTSARR